VTGRRLGLLACALVGIGCLHPAPLAYRRVYQPGARQRYGIRARTWTNGQSKGERVAVSVHEVVGPPPLRERIRFENLPVAPYEVSIAGDAPARSLDLPSLRGLDVDTVGMVGDLHTFLVALSPHAGVGELRRPGDVKVVAELRRPSWADGAVVLLGQDCTQMTARLIALARDTATIETSFSPPPAPCLTMRAPWMAADSNFQQVRNTGQGIVAMWGRESFSVRARVARADGHIIDATLDNELQLTVRPGCNEALTTCGPGVPLHLRRQVTLTAL
jgi:hypothetical protein